MNFEKVTPESVGIHSRDIRTYLEEVYKAGVQLHSFLNEPLLELGKVLKSLFDDAVKGQAVDVTARRFQPVLQLVGGYVSAVFVRI